MRGLTDRVVLVTGAGGGIGQGIARRLDEEGCRLVLADLDLARVEDVAGGMRGRARRCGRRQQRAREPPTPGECAGSVRPPGRCRPERRSVGSVRQLRRPAGRGLRRGRGDQPAWSLPRAAYGAPTLPRDLVRRFGRRHRVPRRPTTESVDHRLHGEQVGEHRAGPRRRPGGGIHRTSGQRRGAGPDRNTAAGSAAGAPPRSAHSRRAAHPQSAGPARDRRGGRGPCRVPAERRGVVHHRRSPRHRWRRGRPRPHECHLHVPSLQRRENDDRDTNLRHQETWSANPMRCSP